MSARLPAHLLVAALVRRVNDAGGIAVVRARGDRDAGAILVIDERAGATLERGYGADGPTLVESGPKAGAGETLDDYWARRRRGDADLWVVALDIPAAKRFVAETILDD